MNISKPRIECRDGKKLLLSTIEDVVLNKTTEVFFSVDNEYGDYLVHENADAFLLAMLWPSVVSGQDIHVKGAISDYAYLHYPKIVYMLSKALERPQIKIFADEVKSFEFNPTAVGTGFSGGIDSFATYINHTSESCPKRFRITHLALFNASAYGLTHESSIDEFLQDAERAKNFAKKVGMPLVLVDSNAFNICADRKLGACTWFISNTLGSIVIALQKLFKTYFLSSSFEIDKTELHQKDQGHYENITYPLISNNNTTIFVAEPELSRIEKTKLISNEPLTYNELTVCYAPCANELYDLGFERNGFLNCGECRKCIRTLLTLDALGEVERYSACFDLDKYRRMRDKMISDLLGDSKDPLRFDVINLMKDKGAIK